MADKAVKEDGVPAAGVSSSSKAESGGAGGGDGALAKYKRLLSMAKSSLESNQKLIGEKDGEIARLQQALKDAAAKKEKLRRVEGVNARGGNGGSSAASVGGNASDSRPRNLLRRVDCEGMVWVLVEYEPYEGSRGGRLDADLSWISFKSEESLNEFIVRVPGKPLIAPPTCLLPEESETIQREALGTVERITEEFRRYKVKSEIIRKQKEAETQQLILKNTSIASTVSNAEQSSSMSLRSDLEKAMLSSAGTGGRDMDELSRMAAQINDVEDSWRRNYEKVVQENEHLRNRGDDSLMASQWRQRYNEVLREKDELAEKLRVLSRGSYLAHAISNSVTSSSSSDGALLGTTATATGTLQAGSAVKGPILAASQVVKHDGTSSPSTGPGSGTLDGTAGSSGVASGTRVSKAPQQKSIEQLYLDLRDEYREFRRRTTSLEQQRRQEIEELRRRHAREQDAGAGTGAGAGGAGATEHSPDVSSSGSSSKTSASSGSGSSSSSSSSSGGSSSARAEEVNSLVEKKLVYIRQMMVQYLTCKDQEVKKNIESALTAMFRFNAAEKALVEARRSAEGESSVEVAAGALQDMVGSLGLGSLGIPGLGGAS